MDTDQALPRAASTKNIPDYNILPIAIPSGTEEAATWHTPCFYQGAGTVFSSPEGGSEMPRTRDAAGGSISNQGLLRPRTSACQKARGLNFTQKRFFKGGAMNLEPKPKSVLPVRPGVEPAGPAPLGRTGSKEQPWIIPISAGPVLWPAAP